MRFAAILSLVAALGIGSYSAEADECPTGVVYTWFPLTIPSSSGQPFQIAVHVCAWVESNVSIFGNDNFEFKTPKSGQNNEWRYANYWRVVRVIDLRDDSVHDDIPDDAKEMIIEYSEGLHSCLTTYVARQGEPSVRYNCFAYALGVQDAWINTIYPWTQEVWTSQADVYQADKATHNEIFQGWSHASAELVPVQVPLFGGFVVLSLSEGQICPQWYIYSSSFMCE